MDTKFSVALHILAMISESSQEQSSATLATSVGTNPSYIRKVLALLKRAQLIQSTQGKSGYELGKPANQITLFEIYCATQETEHIQLFQMHSNPNPKCPVGSHINQAVSPIFSSLEEELGHRLKSQKLSDVIENLYRVSGAKPCA